MCYKKFRLVFDQKPIVLFLSFFHWSIYNGQAIENCQKKGYINFVKFFATGTRRRIYILAQNH